MIGVKITHWYVETKVAESWVLFEHLKDYPFLIDFGQNTAVTKVTVESILPEIENPDYRLIHLSEASIG